MAGKFSNFIANLQSGADSISQISSATTQAVSDVSEEIKDFKLPAIRTESTFNMGWQSYAGLGALILLAYFIFKRK